MMIPTNFGDKIWFAFSADELAILCEDLLYRLGDQRLDEESLEYREMMLHLLQMTLDKHYADEQEELEIQDDIRRNGEP